MTDQIPRADTSDTYEINLGELLNVLAQRVYLIAAIFVLVLVAGIAYAILARPVYEADALIQVEDQKGSALSGLSQLSDFIGVQRSSVSGELEILRSREVLLKAIASTRSDLRIEVANRFPLIGGWLARRYVDQTDGKTVADALWGLDSYAWGGELLEFAEFDVPPRYWGQQFSLRVLENGKRYAVFDGSDNELAQGEVGQRLVFNLGNQQATMAVRTLQGRPGARFTVSQQSPVVAVESLRSALTLAESGKQSNIIRVAYRHHSPAYAQDMVNAIARAYLAQNVERRSAEARSSLHFLEQQLPELKHSVDNAEEDLSQYRSRSGTISITKEAEGLLQQAIKLENNRLELEMRRNELQQRFKPEHPTLKALNQQLSQIDKASKTLNGEIDRLPEAQRDLLRLERNAQVNTQLYISLLNNAQELRIAEAGTIGNVRIIDFAVRNEAPVEPKKLLVVAVAAVLGIMLGLLAAFIAHFLRPAIQRSEQIEQATGLTTYVTVPESSDQKRLRVIGLQQQAPSPIHPGPHSLLALGRPEDPAVESLRSLRTGLTFALMGAPGKVVAISGATSGVGKSFIASNLAALLASEDKRIVLIDTDIRRPRLAEYFGYEKKVPGLSNVLAGSTTWQQALRHELPGLDVLPSGTIPPNPGELLLSPAFGRLLGELESEYGLVILDTAPILPVADTLAIMQHVSAAFLVARAEQSTVAELRDTMTKLRHSGVSGPVKGVIFNGVKRNRVGYGASYKYYYSYK